MMSNQARSKYAQSIIEEARDFVVSLNLDKLGYSYVEKACLLELNDYYSTGIILESYTVLVPKSQPKSTMYYYGTYSNHEFYYAYTSFANMRRETNGDAKNANNASLWNDWVLGTIDVGMCFAPVQWSIPYAIVRNVTGIGNPNSIHYGSYNQHVEQFTNTRTRSIYRKEGTQYKLCYQDQSSDLRVNLYFCPVGTAFSSDYIFIGPTFNGSVRSNQLTKTQILHSANAYANHNSIITSRVSYIRLTETWGS